MKKFLVLFLLVSLVPFTVGCRLFDKGDDVSDPTTTLKLSAVLPAGSFAPSIRANAYGLRLQDMFMEVVESGVTTRLNYESHNALDNGVEVLFSAAIRTSLFNALKGKPTVTYVRLQPVGLAQAVLVAQHNFTVPSTIVAGTSPAAFTPTTIQTAAQIEADITAVDSTATFPKFKVTSVLHGTTEVSIDSAAPTSVPSATSYTFVVKADAAYANTAVPTWKVRVANVRTGARVVTTTGDYVEVTYNEAKDEATIVVTPTSTTPLTVGETYSIVLQETNAVAEGNVALTLPAARYITIAQ